MACSTIKISRAQGASVSVKSGDRASVTLPSVPRSKVSLSSPELIMGTYNIYEAIKDLYSKIEN